MTESRPVSVQELRNRRARAADWIVYASWTAIGTAVLWAVLILAATVSRPSQFTNVVPILTALFAQALIGYKLRSRSQWAAWGLMATYAAAFVLSAVENGIWSGLLFKVLIGYVYVRGWVSTVRYEDLSRRIAQATTAETDAV
jgi:hypothetical protein